MIPSGNRSQHSFSQVPEAEIQRSSLDRSHGLKTTFDSGYLVPVFVDEALPGDTFNLRTSIFARMTTQLVPIMDNLHLETFYFAVPYRLLWENFKEFMDILKKTFNAKIYFKVGNHEERYFHFLWMKAHEIVGVEEFELENIIKSRAEGIEIIKDKRIMKAGDLNIIHGHEFGGSVFSPVNIARGLFLRGKVSAMQGHNHQSSSHSESNMNGEITTTWSLGCLCELHPAYLPINKWNHGFAIVDIDGKNFEVRNKNIYKGQIF